MSNLQTYYHFKLDKDTLWPYAHIMPKNATVFWRNMSANIGNS